jgi:hypothetical protein
VSYFRPPKARKTGPWSITRLSNSTQKMSQKGVGSRLSNSTQKMSQKGGRVMSPISCQPPCLTFGVQFKVSPMCPVRCVTYVSGRSPSVHVVTSCTSSLELGTFPTLGTIEGFGRSNPMPTRSATSRRKAASSLISSPLHPSQNLRSPFGQEV